MNQKKESQMSQFLKVFIVFFLAGSAFLFGNLFKWESGAKRVDYYQLENFSKVLHFVEENYVDKVKMSDLIEGAIQGMLYKLDPHSAYLSPDHYKEMKEETAGRFGGLGIEVTVKDESLTVVAPIEDTPAARAGILSGDRIVDINGENARKMNLADAVTRMRGESGTKVKIKIYRASEEKTLSFELTREQIRSRSVRYTKLEGGFSYLRISSFVERSASELEKAIRELQTQKHDKGFILDLRSNPGGLLDQAIKITNLFMDDGAIVYTQGREDSKKKYEYAQKGRKLTNAAVVVLVDEASASASEIVAGALQDHKRAVIAGRKSFGKGSVQSVIPLGDRAGLKLTVSRYFTPKGRSIQAKGIMPDVILERIDFDVVEEARKKYMKFSESSLRGHLKNASKDLKTQEKEDKAQKNISLAEKLKRDYEVIQALGILKTLSIAKM